MQAMYGGSTSITLKPAFDEEVLAEAQAQAGAEAETDGAAAAGGARGDGEKPRLSEDRQKVSAISSRHVMTRAERREYDETDVIVDEFRIMDELTPKRAKYTEGVRVRVAP